MAVRATQAIIASLSVAGLAHTQATQIVVNVMGTGSPVTRATQLIPQVLRAGALVRATQISISVLVWNHGGGTFPVIGVTMPATYPTLPGLTYSVIKRPKWFTGIGTAATGREVRVAYAENPLWEYELTYNVLHDEPNPSAATASDLKTLMGFYLSMSGAFQPFLFLDPDDNNVTAQTIGATDGVATTWTLIRTYGGADGVGSEPIGYVNTGAPFNVYLNGVLVDPTTYDVLTTVPVNQQVRFHSAPTAGETVTVDMTYYYYVRFMDDHYDFEKFMDRLWSLGKVTLMSQRG